ncbi:uncharacterized protein N7515_007620 [Penicillium bovifimosum]|uniref:Uncharacterized protein n=1 Tax=Penicillium bovifimosum TaxID=126998 RepID=A0A9W9GX60_9EURO|nr:uncharacterized protein N7515_007620 [Penicillium bovifimosum]KAJ5131581.1 hypothetical protein N7515_007620 [Penicillium bovifimosum]
MTIESDDITWFDEDEYIGAEVLFPSDSVWRIGTKIREHSYYETQRDCEELGIQSEARGVFVCSNVSGDGPCTAIIKIRLQSVSPNHIKKSQENYAYIDDQNSMVQDSNQET